MNVSRKTGSENLIVLTEENVCFGGMLIRYRLAVQNGAKNERFRLTIAKGEECCTADAGDDLFFAVDAYQKIVRGRVTPCTLEDVMADLRQSDTKFQKMLYKRNFM